MKQFKSDYICIYIYIIVILCFKMYMLILVDTKTNKKIIFLLGLLHSGFQLYKVSTETYSAVITTLHL